jgi:DNA-binding transcriptional MerR regulator
VNPPTCFPGTRVPVSPVALLTGIFTATSGITLAQVCEITGLEPGTVQNWIKRGYVSPPAGRKYSKGQTARIILISLLRETMPIEKVAKLLSYVNGDLLDTLDDIMDDSDIYQCLCNILIPEYVNDIAALDSLFKKIEEQLESFKEPYPGSKGRLKTALRIMACAYESGRFKKCAIQLTDEIL